MHYHFIAEPMRDTTDTLLGVEMSVRFASDTVSPIHPEFIISAWNSEQKRNFMLEQIRLIAEKRNWFESHNLFCTLNLIDEMALLAIGDPSVKSALHAMPFVALELSERFLTNTVCLNNLLINSLCDGPNALWLGDLGSGSIGASPLVCGRVDVVKLDRGFFLDQAEKPMFPVLIKNIREYCDRIAVEGVETKQLIDEVGAAGVWVMQGSLFPSVAFSEVDTLLLPNVCH